MPGFAIRWLFLAALTVAAVTLKVLALDPLWQPLLAPDPGLRRDIIEGLLILLLAALVFWAARRFERNS